MRIVYHTLGCKVNQYDTNAMKAVLEQAGHETVCDGSNADLALINTCTVTNMADRKSRQLIHKEQGKPICVCGCLAQRDSEAMLAIDGVEAVVGTKNRSLIADIVGRIEAGERKINAVGDIASEHIFEPLSIADSDERTRANLKICEGCNNYCSYCIIPYARGPVRSREISDIAEEAARVAEKGVKEVVVTGIHIGSYGVDLKDGGTLGDVVTALDKVEGIDRIRLGSIEPSTVTEYFLECCKRSEKLCPHFHLSLQSGCDTVLKRMNRKYTCAEYLDAVGRLRGAFESPSITTDVIAGFPQETEEEHKTTLAFLRKIGFSRIHVFPYSDRAGTAASRMGDKVDGAVKKRRAAEIGVLAKEMEREYVGSFVGTTQKVLFEKPFDESRVIGHNERYIEIIAEGELNTITDVKIEGVTGGNKLFG